DHATRLVDAVISDGSEGWEMLRIVRAQVRLAKDDLGGALRDYAHTLEARRDEWEAMNPKWLCACARVALAAGRRTEAADLVAKALTPAWKPPYGWHDAVELALLLRELGRSPDPIVGAAEAHPRLPWLQAAASVARGELDDAADQLVALRCPPLEAEVRLLAAARLVAEGRRGEADEQLQRALAFWRAVGATRYIREAEVLLAATA
ncbi:MAG: hypothetical protein M3377_03115, partial [Actinomycetota bacterium]|nr:hypothetical protein [Actinomycetota bacterium]